MAHTELDVRDLLSDADFRLVVIGPVRLIARFQALDSRELLSAQKINGPCGISPSR